MTAGSDRIRELLAQLADESADVRSVAADGVTDWPSSFDKSEAAVISRVLLWLALEEPADEAREAQLHALAELAEWGLVPAEVLRDIAELADRGLSGSSLEHFEYLQSLRSRSVDLGRMWTNNLRPFAVELARMAGYPFSDSDWIALEHGIRETDAEDSHWFEYPLGRLTIRVALESGANEMVIVSVSGAPTGNEQQRIGWLGDIMRDWHLSGPMST